MGERECERAHARERTSKRDRSIGGEREREREVETEMETERDTERETGIET